MSDIWNPVGVGTESLGALVDLPGLPEPEFDEPAPARSPNGAAVVTAAAAATRDEGHGREGAAARSSLSTLARGRMPNFVGAAAVFGLLIFAFAPQLSHVFVHGKSAHEAALASYVRILAPFVPVTAAATAVFSASRGFGSMTPIVILENIGKAGLRVPFAAI